MQVCVWIWTLVFCSVCTQILVTVTIQKHYYLYNVANAKEALELAKLQEHTEQMKHQEEIRVIHSYCVVDD